MFKEYQTQDEIRQEVKGRIEKARRSNPIVANALQLEGEFGYRFALEVATVALAERNGQLQKDVIKLLENSERPYAALAKATQGDAG